ncbi:MAG: PorP/SprF family type IX secretion system membrane protein [Bacteroidota bacterium]
MKKNISYTIAFCLLGAISAFAQQYRHFSMWNENLSALNPGAVAVMDADLKATTSFRMQWMGLEGNPWRSNSFGIEAKLFKQKTTANCLGVGLNFTNDQSGDLGMTNNLLSVPINYTIAAEDNLLFSIGIAPGFYQTSLRNTNYSFNNQWNGVAYDNEMVSGESFGTEMSVINFDIGAGMHFKYIFDDASNINIGIGVNHITGPNMAFQTIDSKMFRGINLSASGTKYIPNRRLGISPSLLMQFFGPNRNVIFGSAFDIELFEASKRTDYVQRSFLSWGIYYRVQDALVGTVAFKFKGYKLGASYDFNVSALTPATRGLGGFELYFTYAMSTDPNSRIHDRHFRWNRGRKRR